MILTIVSITIDCVTLILATTNLPRDRLMEARIPPPIPNISPNPAAIIKIGAAIFTAAIASLPIPRPTNIPSTTVNNADDTIPSNVGEELFCKQLTHTHAFEVQIIPLHISLFLKKRCKDRFH